jgi:hypothetical protein
MRVGRMNFFFRHCFLHFRFLPLSIRRKIVVGSCNINLTRTKYKFDESNQSHDLRSYDGPLFEEDNHIFANIESQ